MHSSTAPLSPKTYVLLLRQDDPRKCTAAKLAKFRLAAPLYKIGRIPRKSIVLNPFATLHLLPKDRVEAVDHGLVAVDCSWERVEGAFEIHLHGLSRRLPTLLASNPVNYATKHKLSSVEALAAALHIMGFKERAIQALSLFKWGPNFMTLNGEPLEEYSLANNEDEMVKAEAQFF